MEELGVYGIVHDGPDQLRQALERLKLTLQLEEIFYLTTCNRVLFCTIREQALSADEKAQLFPRGAQQHVISHSGENAVRHLFEVASSIHSLVVGEREILKQLRDAYDMQSSWDTVGDSIRLLIQSTVRTAKRIYAKTRIGEKPVSVVSLAVKKFMERSLPMDSHFLLVGAGESMDLVLKHLAKKGYRNFTVFNRSLDRAVQLIQSIQGSAHLLKDLSDHEGPVDCIIACTGAHEPTVRLDQMPKRAHGRLSDIVWIDLGIPADVSQDIIDAVGDQYLGLTTLKELANENLNFRRKEVTRAEHILLASLAEFKELLQLRSIEVAFKDIPIAIKEVKQKAIQEVFAKEMEELDVDARSVINKMMDYMEKKCIGIPMKVAKEIVAQN